MAQSRNLTTAVISEKCAKDRAWLLPPEAQGQQWDIEVGEDNNTYVIKSTSGDYYLGYEGEAANNLQLTGTLTATAWRIDPAEDGKYTIIPAADDNWVVGRGVVLIYPPMVTLLHKNAALPFSWALNKV
ncbi:hypothetical protein BDN72DRAFT_617144 [Pluteus cervinus]|uniref:Uncharacterized protein n=1 Tax=Pluteus cervinus TaxID=181527 RepID=A0ACD3AUX4_9AGAR|nr:hypothetical protein BDN72DRAFT_617144 [Pluteus cervinus]